MFLIVSYVSYFISLWCTPSKNTLDLPWHTQKYPLAKHKENKLILCQTFTVSLPFHRYGQVPVPSPQQHQLGYQALPAVSAKPGASSGEYNLVCSNKCDRILGYLKLRFLVVEERWKGMDEVKGKSTMERKLLRLICIDFLTISNHDLWMNHLEMKLILNNFHLWKLAS